MHMAQGTGDRSHPGGGASGSILLAGLRLFVFVVDTALFLPFVLLAAIGDRSGNRAYAIARWWAWVNARLCGVSVTVDGLAHLDRTQPYVFMSNHRSALDVLTLIVALWDFQLRWVAKRELARIPGFGHGLRATRQIIIDRSDHARAIASLAAARGRLRAGSSVVFFPEGTRSPGPLLPFKKGGFVFAIETGASIVPIGIAGPVSLLRRDGALCRLRTSIHVAIRPAIATSGLTLDDRDVLLARVRWAIASAAHGRRVPPAAARGGSSRRSARGGALRSASGSRGA